MRRSRIVQTLHGDPAASPLGGAHRLGAPYSSHRAPQRVRLGPSLAAALLDGLFEHPAGLAGAVKNFLQICISFGRNWFFNSPLVSDGPYLQARVSLLLFSESKQAMEEIWKPDVVDEFVIGFCGHWWHPSDHHQLEEWYVFKIPHPDSDSTHCAAPLLLLQQRKRLQSPYLLLCPLRFRQCSFWEIATFMHPDGHVCIL